MRRGTREVDLEDRVLTHPPRKHSTQFSIGGKSRLGEEMGGIQCYRLQDTKVQSQRRLRARPPCEELAHEWAFRSMVTPTD